MKSLSRIALTLYLLTLLWLVLFKFSYDISSVLLDHQTRSLNLIPFVGASGGNVREMIDNFVVFVPFGLLLSANLKRASIWKKLALVFTFSLAAEVIQFIFAIGTTDITDVIANTFGGFAGLIVYDVSKGYVNNKKLDKFIAIAGIILLMLFILLRVFVFRVKY
jgi:glycopeptide antibiotics resistance protein